MTLSLLPFLAFGGAKRNLINKKEAARTMILAASFYIGKELLEWNLVTYSQHDDAVLAVSTYNTIVVLYNFG